MNGTLMSELSNTNDPRIDKRTEHKLLDILAISICAAICGANTWDQIEKYGHSKHEWLKTFRHLLISLFFCKSSKSHLVKK